MISRELKQKIREGRSLWGTFIKLNCPTAVELLGASDLDFIVIDGEHAPFDQLTTENLLRAADCVGLPAIVRVPTCDDLSILKALDLGAAGVQLPGVETVAQAVEVVKASRYTPRGRRGLSFSQRSAGYGTVDQAVYLRESNELVINVVHIENRAMAEQVEALCGLDDIDVLFIGPMDLSQSYGHPGNPAAPEVQAAVTHIIDTATRMGKPLGIFVGTTEAARKYEALGVQYLVIGSDASFLLQGSKAALLGR